MIYRFQKEIEKLKKQFLEVSSHVEDIIHKSVQCVVERDSELANEIIAQDEKIDEMEVELEEECLKVLALYQPVATDLRFIVAILKINNDLERIADLAVNIAKRIRFLADQEHFDLPFDFKKMAAIMQSMLRKSIDSLAFLDKAKAYEVLADDQEIDAIHKKMYKDVATVIKADPEKIDLMISVVGISRYGERIADHITNIAEDVIYMIDGDIIRHNKISQ